MTGLNAGDELDERVCALPCLIGRRVVALGVIVDAGAIPFGSYDAGIEINDGLPIEEPVLVGPKVGVDPADFAVAGEVSVLVP